MCHEETRALERLRPRDYAGVGEVLLEQQRSRNDIATRAAEVDERLAIARWWRDSIGLCEARNL